MVKYKLEIFLDVLNQNTTASTLALKDLLGSIDMEPKSNECIIENGILIQKKAYYIAHSQIDTLALIEEGKGSNSLQMRRRWDSNPRNTYHVYTLSRRAPSATRTLLQILKDRRGYTICL